MNLGVNARDAIGKDGAITMTTAAAGTHAEITVRDTGSGIESGVLAHIFEPFFTTKKNLGTGLGLSIVYGIVTHNGGRIEVDSTVGKGTAFRIYFPIAEGAIERFAAPDEAASETISSRLILVVEDNPMVLKVTSRCLESFGCRVLAADGVEHAMNLFHKNLREIDMIVMDVNIPGTDGMVLAKQLKTLRPQAKVLFTSGYGLDVMASPDWPRDADFLPKPFTLDALATKVKGILSASST